MATILIIEDEPDLQRVVRDYLQNAGYTVIQAVRGDEGLSLWRSKHPDLVILDLNLPGLGGLEVAKAIRKEDETPIIMLTARIEETDRLIGLELGADDYIPKPFSPREVVARVKAVLAQDCCIGYCDTQSTGIGCAYRQSGRTQRYSQWCFTGFNSNRIQYSGHAGHPTRQGVFPSSIAGISPGYYL